MEGGVEAAGRARQGLAYEAGKGYPLVSLMLLRNKITGSLQITTQSSRGILLWRIGRCVVPDELERSTCGGQTVL